MDRSLDPELSAIEKERKFNFLEYISHEVEQVLFEDKNVYVDTTVAEDIPTLYLCLNAVMPYDSERYEREEDDPLASEWNKEFRSGKTEKKLRDIMKEKFPDLVECQMDPGFHGFDIWNKPGIMKSAIFSFDYKNIDSLREKLIETDADVIFAYEPNPDTFEYEI